MRKQNKTTDKLTNKAFSRLIITSFLGIFVCIVCLCSSTYAWFSDSVPSSNNCIKTASECLLSISVDTPDGVTVIEDLEKTIELEKDVTYTVTLTLPKDSSSGYCIMSVGVGKYYTDYIESHEDEQAHTLTFEVTVEQTQNVTFEPHWGIYSGETHVANNESLHIR